VTYYLFRIMEILKNFVKLQQEELNIAEIMELVTFPNCGAISNFIGITRDNFENKKVKCRNQFKFFLSICLINYLTILIYIM